MSFVDHLNVKTPLLWVQSDEPRRVINDVVLHTEGRQVFRIDVMEGFVEWSSDQERWLKVLVELEPGEPLVPTSNLSIALIYTLEQRGVLLLEHVHKTIEDLVVFFSHVAKSYVDAFYADDNDQIPATFVLISCKDEVPPELARDTVKVRYELPTEEQIRETIRFVDKQSGGNLQGTDITPFVRAGLGMSEFELAQTCALSLRQNNKLDAEFINNTKLDKLKADGLLEIRVPTIKLADIGGLDRAKELFRRVSWTWNNAEESKEYGGEPLRRVLLVGVPGTGKSAICEAAADALGLELAKFGTSQMMNKYVGESEANMRRAFNQVKAMKPLVLWIDEFGRDMSGGQSSSSVDGGTTDRVHGEFLQGIQELPNEVFLMCAANRIEDLPPEMLRADRFDKVMFVGFPTLDERIEIFRIHLGAQHVNFDLAKLAQVTPTFTGAEIKALIKEVRFQVIGDHHRAPTTDDIVAFAPQMKGRIWTNHRDQVKNMYTRAKTEWDWASSKQEAEADQILGTAANPQQLVNRQAEQQKIGNMFSGALKGK